MDRAFLSLDLSAHHRTRCVTESRNQDASGVRAVCSGTTTYRRYTSVRIFERGMLLLFGKIKNQGFYDNPEKSNAAAYV